MAEQQPERGVDLDLDQSQFGCSVCLDLLKEPVTIPCGHSYCKNCIEDCWDQEAKTGQYSCPQCRETFSPRPLLKRSTMLAELVEKLKESSTQQPSPSLACAGPEDVVYEHRSHNTVSSASERAEQQKQLIESQKKVQQRFQERKQELKELLQALKDFKSCSRTAAESCDGIFNELIGSMRRRRSLTKQLINAQQETAAARAEELQLQLEEEISKMKMKRRDAELEQLSHTDDHIHFIQTFQSLSTSCESPDLPPVSVFYPRRSAFKPVTDCVSKLRDDIESLLEDMWPRIFSTVSNIDVVPPAPKTREEFLRYCRPLTLDQNSVSPYLEHVAFTEPLYPGLGLKDARGGHYAELIKFW
ncbi:hypothetical protein VZT92_017274 [Zoarces viviparus]|uniref:RING-type domain-containing protein n=1 Tax=Zoarces viviparus TaxID=48416 RepID=A0AAW1EQD8_ZOAVI